MSNTDSGVLFLNEWLEVMSSLPAKDYKAIVQAIYNFQAYDIPPPICNAADVVADTALPTAFVNS